MTNKENYLALKKSMKEARQKMSETAKIAFTEMSSEVFDEFTTLKSFGWSQYTPYFNDGEPCEFSANTSYPTLEFLTDGVVEKFDLNTGEDEPDEPKTNDKLREKVGKCIARFLETFEDEDFESMFGDHIKVTVSRDGVETEEYSHD